MMEINPEREKVIDKLAEMLKFFREAPIKNDNSLIIINKQLDDLMSSLKYVPIEPSFDSLPTEIKTDILNYLCDSGAFIAASVSQEWKNILERNLKQVKEISLGKHCSNMHECKDTKCFMPEEFLKAEITHKMDVPLLVCHPLLDIDTELIVEGLTSVSNLCISDGCDCKDEDDDSIILSHLFDDLFEELEKKEKIMDSLELTDMNLMDIDQDELVNYLLNKVKKLTIDEGQNGGMMDNELFIKTLLQISPDSQLRHLTLGSFDYPDSEEYPNLALDFADAVCKVPSVYLFFLPAKRKKKTAQRIVKNILTQNMRMKSFKLYENIDWRGAFTPEDLLKILEKMEEMKLEGKFTAAQVEAVKALPGVEANFKKISKCSI